MITAKLIVLGISVINLGTINEADGIQSRSFWVHNEGTEPTTLVQGYTSCGCTTIEYLKDTPIQPGDSTQVTLHFNPRGKGGKFYESGTVVYNIDGDRKFCEMALEGTCITSEETLLKQHPIKIDNGLRVSVTKYDLGYMVKGEQKERYVSVLYPDLTTQSVKFTFSVPCDTSHDNYGLQHVTQSAIVTHQGKEYKIPLTFDVIIK